MDTEAFQSSSAGRLLQVPGKNYRAFHPADAVLEVITAPLSNQEEEIV